MKAACLSFLGLFLSSFTFNDYIDIDKYRIIIDAKLPQNGELKIRKPENHFDNNRDDYTIVEANYNAEDVKELEDSIVNNDNWILSENIKSDLKIFIPTTFKASNDSYYSIYNKTTNEYNSLPDESLDCQIYAMKYDKQTKRFEMHIFDYNYKK